jgi:hypothetical protein
MSDNSQQVAAARSVSLKVLGGAAQLLVAPIAITPAPGLTP